MMCKSSTKMNYERLLVSYMYFKYVLGERVYSLSGGCSLPLLSPFSQVQVTAAWSAQGRFTP